MMFFLCSQTVWAAAWWGEGYRKPGWVVKHGGTIINYSIINAKNTKRYKAMMFQNGKYVEVEFGNNETFDDAKNGTYVIHFYKCKKSCMPHKYDKKTKIRGNDKKVASITIVARPGETNNLIFDAATNRVFLANRSGGAPKPVDPFIAQKKAAEAQKGNRFEYSDAHKKDYRFNQVTYLAPNIDFATFAQINMDTGITPRFITAQEVAQK